MLDLDTAVSQAMTTRAEFRRQLQERNGAIKAAFASGGPEASERAAAELKAAIATAAEAHNAALDALAAAAPASKVQP